MDGYHDMVTIIRKMNFSGCDSGKILVCKYEIYGRDTKKAQVSKRVKGMLLRRYIILARFISRMIP